MWRNWQTRQTQNLVPERVCGFDPLRRHHPKNRGQTLNILPGNGLFLLAMPFLWPAFLAFSI